MGRYLIKLDDFYLEWSTVVDAPVTYGMTRAEMKEYLIKEYGHTNIAEIEARLTRCDEKGTSSFRDTSAMDTIRFNRAGAGEQRIGRKEIIKRYCAQRTEFK